jgi:ornithine carbamoyltransferase
VQVLCDVFTIEEQLNRSISGMRVAWVGDGSSNMARSFIEAATLFDFHLAIAAPKGYRPPPDEVARAGAHVSIHDRPIDAVTGADVVNTDVWTSMGQEEEAQDRLDAFKGGAETWTVTEELVRATSPHAIVLHCLPAHRGEEIDEATLEGPRARVWDQAENRLHVQKALLCFLIERAHRSGPPSR